MSKRLICSESWLGNKIHVKVYLPVPGSIDKLEAPAMGNSPMERDENIMKFAEEMWFPQYFRAVKRIIDVYERSEMPLRYIIGQEIDIFPMIERVGMYSVFSGKISMDNDSMLDISIVGSGAQIFGHEMGHKLLCVKESNELLENVQEYFGTTEKWAHEIIAELTGEIVANDDTAVKISFIDGRTQEFFKRQILKLAWQ